jgi:hypothetical protein
MDVSPEQIATEAVAILKSSLDLDAKASLDVEVSKTAFVTMFQEAQVYHYKLALRQLMRHLDASPGVSTASIEGSTSSFLGKVRLMQAVAHKAWGMNTESGSRTVCEVGFNAGHSALLWLLAGATRVISFELGQYSYSHVAAAWLAERFPGKLHVVMGDSLHTVPTFSAMFPAEKCNIVVVDGGHLFEHARGDLLNLKKLVDVGPRARSSHVLLVDDTNQPPVAAAWEQAQAEGLAAQDGEVKSPYAESNDVPFTGALNWNGLPVMETPNSAVGAWASSMAFGHFLP